MSILCWLFGHEQQGQGKPVCVRCFKVKYYDKKKQRYYWRRLKRRS